MSDTPINPQEEDVNDVLSSIRDLVSQEAKSHAELETRKRAEAEAEAQAEAAEAALSERTAQEAADLTKIIAEESTPAPLVLGAAELVEPGDFDDFDEAAILAATAAMADTIKQSSAEPLRVGAAERVVPEPAVVSPSTPPVSDAAPAGGTTTTGTPYFDEGMLRNLVGEMVREELQGELGDRINRNIRKLVRREVLRALDAEEEDSGGKLTL